MPATAVTSCTRPASPCAGFDDFAACPFVALDSFLLTSSHSADCLLKNSDDDSRFTAACFVRAMVQESGKRVADVRNGNRFAIAIAIARSISVERKWRQWQLRREGIKDVECDATAEKRSTKGRE